MTPEGEHLALRQEEAIQDSFARQAFMNHLGARLMTVRRGWCEVITARIIGDGSDYGTVKISVLLAELRSIVNDAAFTTKSSEASDTALITVESKINFIAPARGDALVAQGQIVHPGKTLTVCRANVLCLENGKEKLCATSVSIFISIKKE